ncbi:uncharacterized protein [Penaeus vannamei]|uniref:uncharacterized protein n=1 Tax=Penaeus vannamei TaxID=6689 RepID=UPI00387F6469
MAPHCSVYQSTIDCILVLRVPVERCHECGCGLLAAYIDLKKVFDSVHRKSLWEILRLKGIQIWIIGLIASLYTGTKSAVNHCGATLGNNKVTDLEFDFADYITISESLEPLIAALDAFSNEAKPLGLQVSWTKTKIQNFGGLLGEPVQSIHACSKDEEVTESFTYLGSAVHVSGLLDQDVSRWIDLGAAATTSVSKSIWSALEPNLNAFCNKSLCRIMGYSWQGHVSNRRLHTSQETGMGPVTCIIQDCQHRLYEHLARFPVDDPAPQVVSV